MAEGGGKVPWSLFLIFLSEHTFLLEPREKCQILEAAPKALNTHPALIPPALGFLSVANNCSSIILYIGLTFLHDRDMKPIGTVC